MSEEEIIDILQDLSGLAQFGIFELSEEEQQAIERNYRLI